MSGQKTEVVLWGDRTFHIDRVDCTVDLGTIDEAFEGTFVKASFHDVTEQGTANGRLVWTDNPIIQKYIDLRNSDSRTPRNSVFDQFTDEDEKFYEAFIEAVTDMCNTVGPCVSVGPCEGPSSCMSYVEGDK